MTTVQAETAIPTGVWKSDPVHSQVGFAVKHMVVATFRGTFTDFGVTLANEDGEPRLYGAVRTDSVQVRDENLHGHLLSPEFFDSERYPEITFTSTGIRADGGELVVDGRSDDQGHDEAASRPAGRSTARLQTWPAASGSASTSRRRSTGRSSASTGTRPMPSGGVAVQNEVTLTVHLELAREE